MHFPFTASKTSISIFFSGRMCSVPSSDKSFELLAAHLKLDDHDYAVIEDLIAKPKKIARLTAGAVTVIGSTVYHKGTPVNSSLAVKLVELLEAGYNATPWARFMDLVFLNPSEESRESLYAFLDKFNAPITEDGHFIAFKRVRADYMDIYTGKFDNSIGSIVEMPREKVNADNEVTCSHGLHVCATAYLGHTYVSSPNYQTIVCKVSPADVVAVPKDYNSAKMRVCRYEVLGDAVEEMYRTVETLHVVETESLKPSPVVPDLDDEDDFDDEDCDDDLDDVENDDDEVENGDDVEPTEMAFQRNGVTYTAPAVLSGIKAHGQRGYSKMTGIPRTTLQDWVTKIEACA